VEAQRKENNAECDNTVELRKGRLEGQVARRGKANGGRRRPLG